MPLQTQKLDYDFFDYDDDGTGLSLDQAINKARELRSKTEDESVIYRVVPTDSNATEFRVISISKEEVAANFLSKVAGWVARFGLARVR